jgi:L-seryl-tRNA(Ser) seleniumtransferase
LSAEVNNLRSLPSVDQILQTSAASDWIAEYGHSLTVESIRSTLNDVRARYPQEGKIPDTSAILTQVHMLLSSWAAPSLIPVINATGVIIHTNLGRAPLSNAAIHAMNVVSQGYSNLEYDLKKGQRGSRLVHAEQAILQLTGAEAAMVVNNNASAVLLVLTALAKRRSVIIARSQLVEIGGGFRIPDVMKQSGARLIEVGTTNRVHLQDYEEVMEERPVALVMRAHRSNFRIVGFTSEPSLAEIVSAAHRFGVPVVDDLGSGSLLDTSAFGLGHEPTITESLQSGADLVCFSGDKLLGGPQAGIIIGQKRLIDKLKKHPLARAIRADKLCLAALSATLMHYLKDEAEREIPIWQMISSTPEALRQRAENWSKILGFGEILVNESAVGGGSLPGETLPTYVLAVQVNKPDLFLNGLRQAQPPVIARLEQDRILFDPRTVLPNQDALLTKILKLVFKSHSNTGG